MKLFAASRKIGRSLVLARVGTKSTITKHCVGGEVITVFTYNQKTFCPLQTTSFIEMLPIAVEIYALNGGHKTSHTTKIQMFLFFHLEHSQHQSNDRRFYLS